MFRSAASRIALGTALGVGGGAIAFQHFMSSRFGEDALPRLLESYRTVIPAFVQYKYVELVHDRLPRKFGYAVDRESVSAQYHALHKVYAREVFDCFLSLRGFYIKSGQMVASNFGDAAPEYWVKVFEPLLENVPPKPFTTVRATIEADLGRPMEEVFSSFDETCIASASIGQVHRAILKEGGTRVVVKVQYPEVEGQFRGDVTTARYFMEVALPEHVPALKEIEKQFASEFDYRREAEQLRQVAANLKKEAAFRDILVPTPVEALCTKRVLTMTEVENSERLSLALQRDSEIHAASRGMTLAQLTEEERALNEAALAQGVLRMGPSKELMDSYRNTLKWRNFFLTPLGYAPAHVPLNYARLMDTLFEVHGHEVLIDGFFNGDPHPGNLLLSYEKEKGKGDPKLALIDYGQVKRLNLEQRLLLSNLIIKLAQCDDTRKADRDAVADAFKLTGIKTTKMDSEVLFRLARLYFDRDDRLVTEGKYVQAFIEELGELDPVIEIADDFVLVARASLMLRGLGHVLNQHRSSAKAWSPYAEKLLKTTPDALDFIEARRSNPKATLAKLH